ncbi:MAG TPA: RES family NAD+ phosphorylase [Alphaproteobacteria bacterium]|nr:RES family NAD+ phosphorylase [Alphaproteobacteria bacterium]
MIVWRICREDYADLSGVGASLYGGRWNSQGHPVIYTASTLSLAFVELIPGLRRGGVLKGYVSLEIEIPDHVSKSAISLEDFPKDWQEGHSPKWFIDKGDQWIKAEESLTLYVPSIIIPSEKNIIINPKHSELSLVHIKNKNPFRIDSRFAF